MKKNIMLLCAALFLMCSCGQDKIVGTWLQPIPGQESQMQGISLHKDGTASSINMHTLVYESWKRDGNLLTLQGKSIGNGQTINISEQYEIKELNDHHLELKLGDTLFNYTR